MPTARRSDNDPQIDLARATPGELEEHAHALRMLAAQRRRALSLDRARQTIVEADDALSEDSMECVGRPLFAIRRATRRLVEAGWPPAQVIDVLVAAGLEHVASRGDDPTWTAMVRTAVAHGVADGRGGGSRGR